MARKVYVNLQEKHKNSVFQTLKIRKAFSNFDFHLAIRKKIHWVAQLFENKFMERFSLTSQTEHPS